MSALGFTPISLYYSTTAAAVPVNTNLVNGELAINITDGKLFYKDNLGVVQTLVNKSDMKSISFGSTGLTPNTATGGAITVAGTLVSANGGTGFSIYTTGDLLYASATNTLSKLGVGTNGYILSVVGGVPTWTVAPPSGATINNDTSTASNLYPLFSDTTTGAPTTIYTSNAKYLYKPSTGDLQASQVVASNGLFVNATTLVSSYVIASGQNASCVGPFTVPSGLSVTVSSGQRWVIL